MKMTATRKLRGDYGTVKAGEEFEVTDGRAEELERRGLAVPVIGSKSMSAAPKNKMEQPPANKASRSWMTADEMRRAEKVEAAKSGTADPTTSPQNGGPTGGESAVSSSAPAHRPAKRKYTRRKAEHE